MLLQQSGTPSEAAAEYRETLAIQQKLADDNPAVTVFRSHLATSHNALGELFKDSGNRVQAEAEYKNAPGSTAEARRRLPRRPTISEGLASSLLSIGWQLAQAGKTGEAIGYYTREKAIRLFLACCHAGMAGIAGRPGSGVSAADGADQADKSLVTLREAVTMGYRNPDAYRTESALDPLRKRPDFQGLMMDIVMPTKPFAH